MDTTAFGLLLNNLLWKIERRNWATFRTLLAASREKHLATMQHYRINKLPARTCHFTCLGPGNFFSVISSWGPEITSDARRVLAVKD